MSRRPMLLLCALTSTAALTAHVRAVPIWSWESGTPEGWGWTNDIDTGWGTPQPQWTDKVRGPFGATDGDRAYSFKTPATSGFGFDEATLLQASAITGIDPVQAFRWDSFRDNNLMFVDMTMQGERTAPLDPANARYVAFWPAFNGPSQAGGFVGSYDNPIDLNTGATSQYQIVFSTEYYTGPRTRTFTWDYVNAGYNFNALTPTNDAQNYTFLVWSTNGTAVGVQAAMDNVRLYRARATDPTWGGAASGTWSSAGAWANGSPDGVGAVAVLNFTAGVPAVAISLDASKTVGSLVINNAPRNNLGTPLGNASNEPTRAPTAYTINAAGAATLTLDNGAAEASIVSTGTGSVINAPVIFNSNGVIDLTADVRTGNQDGVPSAGGATLTINGNVTIAAEKTLRTTSVGELTLNGDVLGGAGSTLRIGGGRTRLAGTGRVAKSGALSVATSAQLDVRGNALIVDYETTSPLASLTAAIVSGYNAGAWNGRGIVSSLAALDPRYGVGISEAATAQLVGGAFAGQTVTGDGVLIRYTLRGDTNLNLAVNFDDLLALAQNYGGGTGMGWSQGDTNYDGLVNFDDLLALAQNYGVSALTSGQVEALGASFATDFALAQSLVPEPATLGCLGLVAAFAGRRRR